MEKVVQESKQLQLEAEENSKFMESDLGKLFISGISWDTNKDRLKEYFQNFGEVVETVIMKDRTTGRVRGFGFVVFTDPAVEERVVMEKHQIYGRTAKKAVPRDDQHILNRNSSSIHESPGPSRTKKIFVGGLASTVTESEFKRTATKVSEMLGNVNTSSALSAFEKMEEKVLAMESQAEALNQLTSDDLEGKFALLESSSVDDDLASLKKDLSGSLKMKRKVSISKHLNNKPPMFSLYASSLCLFFSLSLLPELLS
ncbi:hypothetical protein Syun_023088 [Stephania yunnanensis]|uniref:RRM domain-containing protein n=1 Tax=Stephania yunnanensis TaxID=152371 RepID=A0AAP0FB49_9MAGN